MTQRKGAAKSMAAYLAVYGPALVLAIAGFVLAYQFVGPPPPKTITMATGSEQGAYYQFGLEYAAWFEQHGIELRTRAKYSAYDFVASLRTAVHS